MDVAPTGFRGALEVPGVGGAAVVGGKGVVEVAPTDGKDPGFKMVSS